MSQPRDLIGYQRGRAHRAAIREMMLEHARLYPLRKPLSGKQIQGRLLFESLALSTVLWHMAQIRAEAEACEPLESF
jgi:hypothetical protein